MSDGLCYHWGSVSNDAVSCGNICPEIVYNDKFGHCFCVLHAPKYYVQPRGFYYGYANSFTPQSMPVKQDIFENALKILINIQANDNRGNVRFDNIYWPENFNNYIDSQNFPDKIFQFIGCKNIRSVSNCNLKALRFYHNDSMALNIHNLNTSEITIIGGDSALGVLIRDSKIDLIVFNKVKFNGSVTICDIEAYTDNGIWGRGISFCNVSFDEAVKLEKIDFSKENRDVIIEDSTFKQGMYFCDNKISGWIKLKHNKFTGSKANFENINLSQIYLNRHCLEYLSFTNCIFPKRYTEMEKLSSSLAEEVYRDLKKISEEKKDYSLVSRWHYLEKEMALLNSNKEGKKLYYMFLWLYRFLCGFGEKPSRALQVLGYYFVFIILFCSLISISHTGIHKNFDWNYLRTFPFSLSDFIPLFKTPSKISLSDLLKDSKLILIIYNLGAALGTIFCIIQVGLLSMAIRNQLKR